jgi:heterodisulfide reductase subunit B
MSIIPPGEAGCCKTPEITQEQDKCVGVAMQKSRTKRPRKIGAAATQNNVCHRKGNRRKTKDLQKKGASAECYIWR